MFSFNILLIYEKSVFSLSKRMCYWKKFGIIIRMARKPKSTFKMTGNKEIKEKGTLNSQCTMHEFPIIIIVGKGFGA